MAVFLDCGGVLANFDDLASDLLGTPVKINGGNINECRVSNQTNS
jgi:hypothetical protein